MRAAVLTAAALVLALASAASASGFATRLSHSFGVFSEEPLTTADAVKLGFKKIGTTCVKGLGWQYAYNGEPTATSPSFLYFSEGGQISGFGARVFKEPPAALVHKNIWRKVNNSKTPAWDVAVATRQPDLPCSGKVADELVGNMLTVNGDGVRIASDAKDAEYWGWYKGNCIEGMGIHWSSDTAGFQAMSFNASTMIPVVPMYDPVGTTGKITSVFIGAPFTQPIEPKGEWEGPFINKAFCANWCVADLRKCNWKDGSGYWTTMHWQFVDMMTINTCTGHYC